MTPQTQTALVQSLEQSSTSSLPVCVSNTEPIPALPSANHVLVRVLAVALNPNDHKMLTHFPIPGHGIGCDFCGIVEDTGDLPPSLDIVGRPGTRVCGTLFPYAPVGDDNSHDRMGAFSEFVVVDARLLLRVPHDWTDLQAAALGGVGWSTVALAMSAVDAMALPGLPSAPVEKRIPVLVYGGGTATGTMASQLLRLSGYDPIAVTRSAASAALAEKYGATKSVIYTAGSGTSTTKRDDCVASINALTAGGPSLRHALDCITDADSASLCFSALARTGGRYACLEAFREAWRTRRVVRVKEVMGYEVLARPVRLGGPESTYTRDRSDAARDLGLRWRGEMQTLLDSGLVRAHPVREIICEGALGGRKSGKSWAEAVTSGLHTLMAGDHGGHKLVVRISQE